MNTYAKVYPDDYKDKRKIDENELCNKCKFCLCVLFTLYWIVYIIAFFVIAITNDLLIYDKKNILLLDDSGSGSNYI